MLCWQLILILQTPLQHLIEEVHAPDVGLAQPVVLLKGSIKIVWVLAQNLLEQQQCRTPCTWIDCMAEAAAPETDLSEDKGVFQATLRPLSQNR